MGQDKLKQPDLFVQAKAEIPMLRQKLHGKSYIYMNNAATALKPQRVIDALSNYYANYGVSIYRGTDEFAHKADVAFEGCRQRIAKYLNAPTAESIVFTRGTTAAINLVARSYGEAVINPGDEIIVSAMEHHANYLPWQQLCLRKNAKLVLAPLDKRGIIDLPALQKLLNDKVKIVAVAGVSNLMGACQDIAAICNLVHKFSPAVVSVDAAQWILHAKIDVQQLDCDFLAFSAHKLYGPTGLGCLYGKYDLLQAMSPLESGGEMVDKVDIYQSTFKDAPWKFEAGTMPIAEVIAFAAALDFVEQYELTSHNDYLTALTAYAVEKLSRLPHIKIYNPQNNASGIIAFNVAGVHPHDAASVFAKAGIGLRAGNHCAQPTLRWLQQENCLRCSLAFFNTVAEVDRLVETAATADDYLSVLFN